MYVAFRFLRLSPWNLSDSLDYSVVCLDPPERDVDT
jgi:hypothetical protein